MKNNLLYGLFILGIIVFFAVRIYYWSITQEVPFSDMANFDAVAHNLLATGSYAWDNFWQGYNLPTLVTLRAAQIYLTGESLVYWRILQVAITFFSLLWLLVEMQENTKQNIYSLALLWIVALSRSSIFWSYKLAREGLAEGLIYLSVASTLWAFRQPRFSTFFLTGIVYMITIFNRANFIFILPVFFLLIILNYYWKNRDPSLKISHQILAFSLGALLIWTPWVVRNYNIYHQIVPLSTQGPYSFLWELGDVTDPATGQTTNVTQLQAEAGKFANDHAAADYAQEIAWQWLQQNPIRYLQLLAVRINSSLSLHQIDLTQVSRDDLLPTSIDNYLLLEKNRWLAILGLLGLIILGVINRHLLIIPLIVISSWLTGILFIGDPRLLEPAIPLILFGVFFVFHLLISQLVVWIKRYTSARPARGGVDRAAILAHGREK